MTEKKDGRDTKNFDKLSREQKRAFRSFARGILEDRRLWGNDPSRPMNADDRKKFLWLIEMEADNPMVIKMLKERYEDKKRREGLSR